MPRAGYIPLFKKKIGRGCQMEPTVLKAALLKALHNVSTSLEKEGFKHGTAVRLRRKVRDLGLTQEKIGSMTAQELHDLYYKKNVPVRSFNKIEPDYLLLQDKFLKSKLRAKTPSQKKLALTKKSIVELYYINLPENKEKVERGEGYLYSISHVLHKWALMSENKKEPVYIKEHDFGNEAEYDFTGVKIPYEVDGQKRYATFIVAVLTGSRYIFVKAIESQAQEPVFNAIVDSFKFFGGCPNVIRIDNFKAAVKESGRYQGQLTDEMRNFKEFFNIAVFTCRAYKPKDKGIVEASVKYVTRYALSIANNYVNEGNSFHSLKEINDYIAPYIAKINQSKVRGTKSSREELLKIEQPILQQPASWDYQYFKNIVIKVPQNSRFLLNQHEYAIPPKWIGEKINVHITNENVAFLNVSSPIVSYRRLDGVKQVSAIPNIIPKQHLSYDIYRIENQNDVLLEWAEAIGPNTKKWCLYTLKNSRFSHPDKIRYINKFLSIVKGNTAHYAAFDKCVHDNMYVSFKRLTSSKMLSIWEKKEKPNGFVLDKIYTQANYIALGKYIIYGKATKMKWSLLNEILQSPLVIKQKTPEHSINIISESKEYLNGIESYSKRFSFIKSQLN